MHLWVPLIAFPIGRNDFIRFVFFIKESGLGVAHSGRHMPMNDRCFRK